MKILNVASIVSVATAVAAPAYAHTSFVVGTAVQETTIVAQLQVPHGCEGGLATNEVRVKLPEGFISAKPQPKAGWQVEVIKGDYKKTYDNHGKEVKNGPVEIRWKGGELPNDFYDTFNFQGRVSGVEAGVSLPFAVTQLCGEKASVVWDQVAKDGEDPHSLDNPAPVIRVTAKQAEPESGHSHGHAAAASDVIKVGDIELSGGTSKSMLPGQPVGGGFITITNNGKSDDRLMAVETPVAGRGEIHEMKMVDNVMKMRKLAEGITIPAGETVELKPGGLHFMFFDVSKPFAEGQKVPVTLTFEKAGKVKAELEVGSKDGGEAHKHN